jgi:hypothetical protein
VLIARNGDEHFEQFILDERLYAAKVARADLRTATLASVVSELLALDLPLVSWSSFDCHLVSQTDVDAALKRTWTDLCVNALLEAKTWRTKVHPAFPIARASEHDAKHTLDQYAELADYAHVAKLRGAQPARWIRHLQEQLAARTHYRRVTKQAKRDWHKLLEYNRHDCCALREVYGKARFELEKWREYENTDYYVFDGDAKPIRFRAGSTKPRLDALLDRYGATRWAFLTAWNPGSTPLPDAENTKRQDDLLAQLLAAGYRCLPGEGRGEDSSWPPEESILALDIPENAARNMGARFGQLAIVTGRRGTPARLVACL